MDDKPVKELLQLAREMNGSLADLNLEALVKEVAQLPNAHHLGLGILTGNSWKELSARDLAYELLRVSDDLSDPEHLQRYNVTVAYGAATDLSKRLRDAAGEVIRTHPRT